MLDLTSPAATGLVLGLSAGLSPGPLLTLMLSETLRHGLRAGIMVALAPLCTDLPIILLTLVLHWMLPDHGWLEAVLSLAGGGYLLWLGAKGLRPSAHKPETSPPARISPATPSLRRAIIANLLNPNPYIFWMTIGVPAMLELSGRSVPTAGLFVLCFYALLVGSKTVVAVLTARSASFLAGRSYVLTLMALSLCLCGYGLMFIYRALHIIIGA